MRRHFLGQHYYFEIPFLVLRFIPMILTKEEAESLLQARNRSPHSLLGMHQLGGGKGIVVRAFVPGAAQVEVLPARGEPHPKFKLEKINEAGLFEGTSAASKEIYAYDL